MGKLNETLKRARAFSGLTLRDIEQLSDGEISNAFISQIENGHVQHPSPRSLRILARILKLNYLELMIYAGHLTIRDLKGRV
jgi:transcriptional regulator with XRE-family HTH domain